MKKILEALDINEASKKNRQPVFFCYSFDRINKIHKDAIVIDFDPDRGLAIDVSELSNDWKVVKVDIHKTFKKMKKDIGAKK